MGLMMNTKTKIQLSVMMFLEFFVWGAWYVTLGTYLGKGMGMSGDVIGKAYSTMPWGALIAPFFVGMIADRFFSAQKILGILHLLGGVFLYLTANAQSSGQIFWYLLIYSICYNPTLALINTISFHQMQNTEKQFPAIRVLGTIGWIVAGLLIGFMKIEDKNLPLLIAAGASIVLGIFSFFLPMTPPASAGQKISVNDILGVKAWQLLKDRSFAVFIISALLICIPLTFYYSFTNLFLNEVGVVNAAGKMTLGQISETLFMLAIPFFFARLGIKKMLLVAILAWGARYALFAYGNPGPLLWFYYIAIALHGVCYDFFFVIGQIYVGKRAPQQIQASAQGLFTLVTYGVGMMLGARASGLVAEHYQIVENSQITGHHWTSIWLVPAIMAVAVSVFLGLFFRENNIPKESN